MDPGLHGDFPGLADGIPDFCCGFEGADTCWTVDSKDASGERNGLRIFNFKVKGGLHTGMVLDDFSGFFAEVIKGKDALRGTLLCAA